MNRIFFSLFFMSTCWSVILHAAELPLRIVHKKGHVTTLSLEDNSPQAAELGFEYSGAYKIFTPDFAELVLKHDNKIELNLAGLSNLEFLEQSTKARSAKFAKGHLLYKLFENNQTTHMVKVPYGEISWLHGDVLIEVRMDNTAYVYADEKEMQLLHMRGQKKTLKEGEAVIIDRYGFKTPKSDANKTRVIFDFSRDGEKEKQVMKATATNSKEAKEEAEKKSGSKSATVKGKVAEDAKIVEGDGDGEGEYKWDLGPNLLFFLIPVALLAAIIAYFKLRKPKAAQPEQSDNSKEEKDSDYEAEDVYVIRGNLTSNDEKLVTSKTTHILGDVEDGAEIEATHKLMIKGSFQGAKLSSTHNVSIDGGINGMSKADLQINGDLKTTYISEANILCTGTVKVDQAIRNSKVAVEGLIKVEKKDIIGGVVASRSGIECETLGSDFGETEIALGQDPFTIWKESFELKETIEPFKDSAEPELNTKASIKIFSEVTNSKITLGTTKLDQKKVLPGPVESHYELSDGGKLTFRGFRRDD